MVLYSNNIAREKTLEHPESLINQLSSGNKIDGKIIFEAEKAGACAAKEVVILDGGVTA